MSSPPCRNRSSHHLRHAFLPSPKHTLLLHFTLSIIFLLLATAAAETSSTTTSSTNLSDDLLTFKSTLPNPSVLSNWNPSTPPCSFTGVTCSTTNTATPTITTIDLTSILLSTTLTSVTTHLLSSPSLATLVSLTLQSTNLTGQLTPPLTTCPESLTYIDLSNNHLTAAPLLSFFSACSSLTSLNLSSNELLPSPPPSFIFTLPPNLQTLDLSTNLLGVVGDDSSSSSPSPLLESILSTVCTPSSHLTKLILHNNKLTGKFNLDGCDSLQYLDLSANNFSTQIPNLSTSCDSLRHLDLSSNKFTGAIPPSTFTNCVKLTHLNISYNEFTGQIPSFPTSSPLKYIYLSSNQFSGGFVHTNLISSCSTLLEIEISSNNLTGDIPTAFNLCSSLTTFDLSRNNLTGSLPINIFLKMTKLTRLSLSFNRFTGELPNSLASLTGLQTLDLSANNFSGEIPSGLCHSTTTALRELYLQDNTLTGTIPTDLGNCSELVSLDLSFNHLHGPIPGSLGSLSKLKDLIMWMNQLSGEIPSELMYIQSLENLILDYNRLSGSIPSGLRNCSNLNWISLSSNQLSGVIPSWIGELLNLAILKLSDNEFRGEIPPEMGDCKKLLWVDLNSNLLTGTIPATLAKQSGKLAVGLVVGKEYVYIRNVGGLECHGSGNLYEFAGIRTESLGGIPSRHKKCNVTRPYRGNTQPNFQHNGTMMFIDFSHNLLEGSIPKDFGSMYYLQILNLAHNHLSGPIPDELGGMKTVGVMDLSNNDLSGRIPSSFSSLSLLAELDLSNNNLSGQIPASGQFETFPANSFYNNSGLCGYPLPKCGKKESLTQQGQHQRGRSRGTLAGSVAMGLLFSLFCIFGMIIVYVELRKRRMRKQKEEEAALESGENHHRGNSNSGPSSTAWKLTGAREALSINLATFDKPLRKLTFADLLDATNGFHNDFMIGSGGFGDVYRAKLKDGSVVAIKKLIQVSGQGDREFTAEMETIGKIKHRNLVPLLGYCKVGDERLLVYEYMKYGSLDDVLHEPKKAGITLNWSARRKIAIGAARGLAFLHHNCAPHIIHRDMKSSNVLLDENLEARVSDFGMARLMSAMDTHLSVSTLAGTPGYVPPEYYQSFRCSTSGDVYSYGVVLLELLTGKQPTDSADFGDNNLVGWVKQHARTRISDVFDPVLLKEDPGLEIELLQHLKVACACLDDRPRRRPTMIQVMAMFKEIQAGSGLDSGTTATTVDDDDNRSFSMTTGSFSTVDGVGTGVDMSMKEIPEGEKLQ